MKLRFELTEEDENAVLTASDAGEKRMYVVPYTIENDKYCRGYLVVTDRRIMRVLQGKILETFSLTDCTHFTAESMYGSAAFIAQINGVNTVICRFSGGRHLVRYTVLATACNQLADRVRRHEAPGDPVTDSTPEKYCPKCGRLYHTGTEICPYCRDSKEAYKKLWGYTRGYRLLLFAPVVVSILTMIVNFVMPAVQSIAVDDYLTNESIRPVTGSLTDESMRGFALVFLSIVGLELVLRILEMVQFRLSSVAGNRFSLMMRSLLFEKVSRLSIYSIQKHSTGDLMGRIKSDTGVVGNFVVSNLPQLVIQLASFLVAFVAMMIINPLMCLMTFIPLPIVVFIIKGFWGKMRSNNRLVWNRRTKAYMDLQDTMSGIRVVKTFGNEKKEIEKYHRLSEKFFSAGEHNSIYFDTAFTLLWNLVRVGSFLVLFYGNYRLFHGTMSYGDLYLFNSYAAIVYGPLMWVTFLPQQISDCLTSFGKIVEIMDEKPEIDDIDLPIDIHIEGDISFKNVSFGYESYDRVLNNISFDIKKGEMIGIVGLSGSGKTTLINLLMHLYNVSTGEITIDDVNIKDISQEALHSQTGIVLQETNLFEGTIADNIRYANPHATEAEVIRAAKVANAHNYITNLPNGYDTKIGSMGHSLSGGERQRIAIARAVICNPRILILDEATAALDSETELLIQQALDNLTKDRTTIAIAHRLSTLRNADRILVLDKGNLVEFGTHRELLDKKGYYWKLVMAQAEEFGAMEEDAETKEEA